MTKSQKQFVLEAAREIEREGKDIEQGITAALLCNDHKLVAHCFSRKFILQQYQAALDGYTLSRHVDFHGKHFHRCKMEVAG